MEKLKVDNKWSQVQRDIDILSKQTKEEKELVYMISDIQMQKNGKHDFRYDPPEKDARGKQITYQYRDVENKEPNFTLRKWGKYELAVRKGHKFYFLEGGLKLFKLELRRMPESNFEYLIKVAEMDLDSKKWDNFNV